MVRGGYYFKFCDSVAEVVEVLSFKRWGVVLTASDDLDILVNNKGSITSRRRRRQQCRRAKNSCSDKKKDGDEASNIMVAVFLAFTYA